MKRNKASWTFSHVKKKGFGTRILDDLPSPELNKGKLAEEWEFELNKVTKKFDAPRI